MMYGTHSASASRRATKWSYFGTMAAKRGRMNNKYRKGGKTLCALYAKEKTLGLWLSWEKMTGAKFEIQRGQFSNEVQMIYDAATTFHDGKWIMFELKDTKLFNDMERLLLIKRKPNRKAE